MKRYIRYFETKSFWNIFLKGTVFHRNKKYGFYLSKDYPMIYLKAFDEKVKSISIKNSSDDSLVDTEGQEYAIVDVNQYIHIIYNNGSEKKIAVGCDDYGKYLLEF